MKKKLRGFSFFEVILYLGLFSVMAMALLQFSWNVLDLGVKDRTVRHVFSDARFATERINYFIRSAAGIDTGSSAFGTADGKLVLNKLHSSDTVTIDIQNGNIVLTETGEPAVILNSSESKVESLSFLTYGFLDEGSEYVGFVLTLESAKNNMAAKSQYQTITTIESGASIRNDNL